jgi:hypothetical protein
MTKAAFLILFVVGHIGFSQVNVTSNKAKKPIEIQWEEPTIIELFGSEPNTNAPKTHNAGLEIGKEIPMTGTFTFNKKIGFMVHSPEGDFVTHFYLNTKNGYSMMDWQGLKDMAEQQTAEGEMNQIFSPNGDLFQYSNSSEGNFAMKMGSGQSMVLHDLQTADASKEFFKTFKKSGSKAGNGDGIKIPRIEYAGIHEGKKMSIWLSNAKDILIDKRFTSAITGYFGLGYIASPSGKTYLMSGFQGSGVSIFITYVENCSKIFSGKGYQPIGNMMAEAMGQNISSQSNGYAEMQEGINNETDPQLRVLKIEALKNAKERDKNTLTQVEKFAKSSDMVDIPYVSQVNDPKATADYYDMMIIQIEQAIREHELGLKEGQKNNDAKVVERYNCLISCTKVEKVRLEKVKAEHIRILNQYTTDEEKRDEKINQLMERQGMPKSCNCE